MITIRPKLVFNLEGQGSAFNFLVSEVTHVPRWGILSVYIGRGGDWQTAFISSSDMVRSDPPQAQKCSRKLRLLPRADIQGLCAPVAGRDAGSARELEARPGEGQVTGASSLLPHPLFRSSLSPQDPRALARVLSSSVTGPRLWKEHEKISKWNSSLQLPSAFT